MSSIEDEAQHWVMRQANGEMNAAESAAFDSWFAANTRHQGAYLRASAIQYSFDQITVQDSMKPAAASVGREGDDVFQPPARSRRTVLFGGALAASLAALALVILQPPSVERTILNTAQGEFRKVPLADRSMVSMNSGTTLEVAYSGAERRIVLTRGEAWFEVAKDRSKPFIVESGDVRVRAVGTAFAVRRHSDGADVLVTEGLVDVWSDSGKARKKQLAAGSHAFIARHAAEIRVSTASDDIERKLAWRSGKLVFRNNSVAEAAADFNRYNTRQLIIADPTLARKTLVGQYRIDQPELFANDVRTLFRAQVTLGLNRITIGKPAVGQTEASP